MPAVREPPEPDFAVAVGSMAFVPLHCQPLRQRLLPAGDPVHPAFEDCCESASIIVVEESFDILKPYDPRLLCFNNPCDVKEESTSRIIESSPISSNAESLARESST